MVETLLEVFFFLIYISFKIPPELLFRLSIGLHAFRKKVYYKCIGCYLVATHKMMEPFFNRSASKIPSTEKTLEVHQKCSRSAILISTSRHRKHGVQCIFHRFGYFPATIIAPVVWFGGRIPLPAKIKRKRVCPYYFFFLFNNNKKVHRF